MPRDFNSALAALASMLPERPSRGAEGWRVPDICVGARRRGVFLVVLSALCQAAAAGLAAFATRSVFAHLHADLSGYPWAPIGLLALSGFLLAAARIHGRTVAERLGLDYAAELRARLFRRLARSAVSDVSSFRQGAISIRFVGDLKAVRGWVSQGLTRLIAASIVLPIAAVVLYAISPAMAFGVAPVFAIGLLALALMGPRLEPLHRAARKQSFRLAARMMERGPVAPELRALGRMPRELRALETQSDTLAAASVRRAKAAAALRATPDVVWGVSSAVVVLIAFAAELQGADLAAGLALLSLMAAPMRDIAGVWDRHRAWRVARERCERFLMGGAVSEPRVAAEGKRVGPAELRFVNVKIDDGRALTAVAKAGQKIAVTGPSGSGKSLILAIAAGLEVPKTGEIRIDDAPLGAMAAGDVRHIGARAPMLRGSLRRALTLGVQRRPEDGDLRACAEAFGLGPLIERIGLDGRVSERGVNVSRGDWARILMVRAALAKPRLLLIDDLFDLVDADARAALIGLVRSTEATVLIAMNTADERLTLDDEWRLTAPSTLQRRLEAPSAG